MSSRPYKVEIRRGTEADEFPAFEVMRRAMGYEMVWQHHEAPRRHLRTTSQSSFWVAEERGLFIRPHVVAYARSIVRERVWQLTEFFVHPDRQRGGIGGQLLEHCLEDGTHWQAEQHFVLASYHPAAVALYTRRVGCVPRVPMLLLVGPTINLNVVGELAGPLQDREVPTLGIVAEENAPLPPLLADPLPLTAETQELLAALDRETLGFARPEEHAYWLTETLAQQGTARLFREGRVSPTGEMEAGEVVGYGYMNPHSSGPVLARNSHDLPRLVTHLTALQRRQYRLAPRLDLPAGQEQYLAIAGTNALLLRWLLDCGWRIVFQYVLMSSHPFPHLDRYLCHSPLHFL